MLGYERYKVRSVKEQSRTIYWVDAYTKSGLTIKTEYDYLSGSTLSRSIEDTMNDLYGIHAA
jgi:hypothetical protein